MTRKFGRSFAIVTNGSAIRDSRDVRNRITPEFCLARIAVGNPHSRRFACGGFGVYSSNGEMSDEEEKLKALQDAIYREKVERARRMTPLEKFLAGEELFELGCKQMLGNIRTQMPDVGEEAWRKELKRRLAIGRRLEEAQLEESYAG